MNRFILAVVLVTTMSGCASKSATSPSVSAPTVISSSRAEWRYPPGRTGVVLDLRIAVRVGADGFPVMESLQVTGLGAAENRDAAAAWIQTVRFRPAQQAGQPVEGVYRTRVQVRAEARRVGS